MLFKKKKTPSGELVSEAIERFKRMLVKRYNWSVRDANRFSHSELKKNLLNGKSIEETYFVIFNKESDLAS